MVQEEEGPELEPSEAPGRACRWCRTPAGAGGVDVVRVGGGRFPEAAKERVKEGPREGEVEPGEGSSL